MIPMCVPWIICRTRSATVRPILVLAPPIDRHEPRARFDEPAGEQNRLTVTVPAIHVAHAAGLQPEVECAPHLRPRQQGQSLLLKTVEVARLALPMERLMAIMDLIQQQRATRKSLTRNLRVRRKFRWQNLRRRAHFQSEGIVSRAEKPGVLSG